jgi:hypothetical protein
MKAAATRKRSNDQAPARPTEEMIFLISGRVF